MGIPQANGLLFYRHLQQALQQTGLSKYLWFLCQSISLLAHVKKSRKNIW